MVVRKVGATFRADLYGPGRLESLGFPSRIESTSFSGWLGS
jgi:hypothetical protein